MKALADHPGTGDWARAEAAYSVVFYAGNGKKGFDVYLLKGEAVNADQVMLDMSKALLSLRESGLRKT